MVDCLFDLDFLKPEELKEELGRKFSSKLVPRDRLSFLDEYIDLIVTGQKKTTIRFRHHAIDYPQDKYLPVFTSSNQDAKIGEAKINVLRVLPIGELTEQDAINDGFSSLLSLKKALNKIYGEIEEQELVSIYEFKYVQKDKS